LLFGKNRLQHIAGLGDVGKIDLGFKSFALRLRRTTVFPAVAIARSLEVGADLLRLVLFERAGMGLLLGNPDFRQHIENGFAFYFQLSCQIVNSNLTHPPFILRTISR
jgi:hypothetical protein